jgi:outer membrane beta-barrel protein
LPAALLLLARPVWAQAPAASSPPDDGPPEEEDEAVGPPPTRVSCLEDLSEDGYQRKGVQKRDFLKKMRGELAGVGGFYASDALSSTYTFGGALAFFPAEDFGLEVLVTQAPVKFRLEEPFTAFDQSQRFIPGKALQVMGGLLFSPFHAKFKITDATILHGDLFFVAGAGRNFHHSVQGLAWQGGLGLQLYLYQRLSFRLDLRDFVLPQEVLGRGRITNNVTILGGLAFWLG